MTRRRTTSTSRRAPATSHWRSDYRERLASYGYEYAHAVVLGFNLPERGALVGAAGTSTSRRTERTPAGAAGSSCTCSGRGYTAGCVAGPLSDIRWTVRWLDPADSPRIVMGPTAWVKRRF